MNSFLEITSNDNWFKQHPEKIAGEEYETTSYFFPIMVKGTKDDVLRVTGMDGQQKEKSQKTLLRKVNPLLAVEPFIGYYESFGWKVSTENQPNDWVYIYGTREANTPDKEKRIRLAKAKAKAIKIKLLLK